VRWFPVRAVRRGERALGNLIERLIQVMRCQALDRLLPLRAAADI